MNQETGTLAVESSIKSLSVLKDIFGTNIISFAVLSERFSFWGLQAILVLFLIQVFSKNESDAFTLVGAFGAMSYAFSLIGGLLADKLLGIWRSCLLGIVICLLGNCILFLAQNLTTINLGLSCVLVGAGLFSPSSNNLIRMLFDKKAELKESAFLIACIAGNISGALAPFVYGIFGDNGLWQYAFLTSAVLNFLAIVLFLKNSKHFFKKCGSKIDQIKISWVGEITTVFLILSSLLIFMHVNWLNMFLIFSVIPFTLAVAVLYKKLETNERKHIGFLFILTMILLLFYTAVFQIYSSMTMFVAAHVNRVFFSWIIPVPAFASLQCIFFILCAPIVERLLTFLRKNGYDLSLLVRIPIGLGIGALGFMLFAAGEWIARKSGYCGTVWIVGGNVFLGLGEVLLYPPILSAIATFSPKRWAGTFMGIFSLSLALSSYFSGQLAKIITQPWVTANANDQSILNLGYARVSICLFVIILMTTVIFFYINKWYDEQRKLIESNT